MTQHSAHQHIESLMKIEEIYNQFLLLQQPEKIKFLSEAHIKKEIIKQVYFNLGLAEDVPFTEEVCEKFSNELHHIVYINSGLPNFIENHDEPVHLEQENFEDDNDHRLHVIARNLYRHLVRGIPLCEHDGDEPDTSPVGKDGIVLKALLDERNPAFLQALRMEMQAIFNNAKEKLSRGELTEEQQLQYELFQNTFLGALPFLDPKEDEIMTLPMKIEGQWHSVEYKIKRIDISPKTGLLGWLLEEEDRAYAFALESQNHPNADSHLICAGTTYPAGQGANLAVAYNFYPRHSAGEGHDLEAIQEWMDKQNNKSVHVTGHSKGGTMAQILSVLCHQKVKKADALCPTGLCGDTLERLNNILDKLSPEERNAIDLNVYRQLGDKVYAAEKGFLALTKIFSCIPNTDKSAMNCGSPIKINLGFTTITVPLPDWFRRLYEAHIHHFSGREMSLYLRVNVEQENLSRTRELVNDVKYHYNWMRFPLEYMEACVMLMARKTARFYNNHTLLINSIVILASLTTAGILFATGILSPLALLAIKPAFAALGWNLTTALSTGITIGLSVLGSLLLPIVLKQAVNFTVEVVKQIYQKIIFPLPTILTLSVILPLAALKVGLHALFGPTPELIEKAKDNNNIDQSSPKPKILPVKNLLDPSQDKEVITFRDDNPSPKNSPFFAPKVESNNDINDKLYDDSHHHSDYIAITPDL